MKVNWMEWLIEHFWVHVYFLKVHISCYVDFCFFLWKQKRFKQTLLESSVDLFIRSTFSAVRSSSFCAVPFQSELSSSICMHFFHVVPPVICFFIHIHCFRPWFMTIYLFVPLVLLLLILYSSPVLQKFRPLHHFWPAPSEPLSSLDLVHLLSSTVPVPTVSSSTIPLLLSYTKLLPSPSVLIKFLSLMRMNLGYLLKYSAAFAHLKLCHPFLSSIFVLSQPVKLRCRWPMFSWRSNFGCLVLIRSGSAFYPCISIFL